MKSPKQYLVLSLALLIISSTSIEVRIMTPQMPGSLQQLNDRVNLKLSINSGDRFIYGDSKNSFQLPTLITARNMVEVVSDIYLYPILMIDQRAGQSRKYSLLHPATRQVIKNLEQPLVLTPIERINYFDAEGGFSIKSVLFSSYGIMIGVGILMYFCYQNVMPKLEEAQQAPNR